MANGTQRTSYNYSIPGAYKPTFTSPRWTTLYMHLGKLDHDLNQRPSPGNHRLITEIILFYGRKIQVSEL